jgi:hypothetical protein
MLNVVMLSVVMLNVVKLSVVAPLIVLDNIRQGIKTLAFLVAASAMKKKNFNIVTKLT